MSLQSAKLLQSMSLPLRHTAGYALASTGPRMAPTPCSFSYQVHGRHSRGPGRQVNKPQTKMQPPTLQSSTANLQSQSPCCFPNMPAKAWLWQEPRVGGKGGMRTAERSSSLALNVLRTGWFTETLLPALPVQGFCPQRRVGQLRTQPPLQSPPRHAPWPPLARASHRTPLPAWP